MKKSQKYKPIKREDYDELVKNALSPNSTKLDRMMLWFWFGRFGESEDFDGEGYRVTHDKRIYPVYQMIKDFDGDVIGHLISDAVVL